MRTLIFLFAVSTLAAQDSQGLVLANDHVRLEFEPSGMGLKSMVDRASGKNHIQSVAGPHQLWQVKLGRGTVWRVATNNYKPCNHARIETLPGGYRRAVMEWNGLRWWKEDKALTVRVTVDLAPDSGIATWRIFVDNHSDYWGVQSVTFPSVDGFPASGAYDVARPVFASGGSLLRNCTAAIGGRHPSGGWPMQFASLHQQRNSVYLGTQDADGRAKDFSIEPGKQVSVLHYPENLSQAGSHWPDFYAVEFGPYQGSWVEAARHYRQWALRQKWASAGKLSQRHVPELARQAAFWVRDSWIWNDALDLKGEEDPHELNAPLLAAQHQVGAPTAIHWYNWQQAAFDNQYPHFLPARKGFVERVKELVSHGILVMPYINGCSADMNIPDWSKFAPYAVQDEAGGWRHHYYSESAGRLLTMCPTQSFWQSTIAGVVESLVGELGVNGVYIDQISAMEHELCFNPAHGHPLGGGRYWTDGNRELLRMVRNVAERSGRAITITSEGADEVFLDLVDGNLTWAQPNPEEIPLMEMVYSGYTLFFGSPCDYRQSDRLFRFAQGQALIDGRQNGWMNLRLFDPRFEGKIKYLKSCVHARVAWGKYLTYGQLVEPVLPLDPIPSFTESHLNPRRAPSGPMPLAEARLWEAEDGGRAVFFANYSDQPVPFRYRVGAVERTEILAPASVRVVELPR